MLKVCVSGATGSTGGAVAEAVVAADDMALVSTVSRKAAGGQVLGAPCFASVAEALAGPAFDVLIDYTALSVVEANTRAAIAAGRRVVIGTSGLTAAEFEGIDAAARAAGTGVIASGNFALTAALMTRFSLMAAEYLDWFEIIDYSRPSKTDAPTGTARELAERMGRVRQPAYEVDPAQVKAKPDFAAARSPASRSIPAAAELLGDGHQHLCPGQFPADHHPRREARTRRSMPTAPCSPHAR
ncbi:MAG: hypothetical protein R3D59_04205 [Paracoccaceae bacterium]